jgi:putative salt-induced outer membrane protein
MRRSTRYFAASLLLSVSQAALADIPAPIKAMLDAASAKDAATLGTIAGIAKATNPDAAGDIDAYVAAWTAAQEEARVAKIESQGFFEGWTGQGNIGLSFTSGNSKNSDLYAGIGLSKETLRWRHSLAISADMAKNNGVKNREKYAVTLQSSYKFNDRMYAYGLLGWERNPYQGYSRRFTESVGIGYRVIKSDNITWDLEGGPALRQTRLVRSAPPFPFIANTKKVSGRVASNLMVKVSDTIVFTNGSGGIFNQGSDSIYSHSLLSVSLSDRISAGFGFDLDHETQVTAPTKKTDTTTRVTVGYKF